MNNIIFKNPLFLLFFTFLRIGAVTFGGGYAMLPLIKFDIVEKKQWLKEEDFLDTIAIAQSVPGAVAVNTAIYTGYKIKGLKGAFVSLLGTVIPSFVIILAIAIFFIRWQDVEIIERAFKGIRPAVVGLIFGTVISLGKSILTEKKSYIFFISAFLLALASVNPFVIILLAGTAAIFLFKNDKEKEDEKNEDNKGGTP